MTSTRKTTARTQRSSARIVRALTIVACAGFVLAGCGGGSMADLRAYAEQVKQRTAPPIEQLPPIEPYVVYNYACTTQSCPDPFEPFYQETTAAGDNGPPPCDPTKTEGPDRCITPDFNRNREELEQYALDSLRMMGTLERDPEAWGIVRSPDSIIHRVQVGNYMGKNYGKITDISEERIVLMEIIPDGQGGWMEREASLALVE